MKLTEFATGRRAVSPVVGVTLLIGIAVILAAVIGGVVLGIGLGPSDAPQATIQGNVDTGANDLVLSHEGGDPIDLSNVEVRGGISASTVLDSSGTLQAGETKTIDIGGTYSESLSGDVSLVYIGEDGDSETVLATIEA